MKVTLSKRQWESIGKQTGWMKTAMGAPRTDYSNHIEGIIQELISAQSSLNMEPSPISPEYEGGFYLSETDEWAKHAYEHIGAALKLATKLQDSSQSF